jgi:hypothetical protein
VNEPFRITGCTRRREGDSIRLSALLDGREVWFQSTGFAEAPESGDPWLAVALLAAMAQGRPLDLRDGPPVSTALLDTLETIQSIWTQWNPWLQRIAVHAHDGGRPGPRGPRTGTFFSGGIDATHAVLAGAGAGELLAFLGGFDYRMTDEDFAHSVARVTRLAKHLGGELVSIRTNWIDWRRDLRLSASLVHGGALAACAMFLAPSRMTIASSNSWARMTPWGTHPFVDPLWSTERTAVRHFGNHATRIDKIEYLSAHPSLLADLWVCHAQAIGNCGRCPKCLRTQAMFHLVGAALPVAPTAGDGDPIRTYLRLLKVGSEQVYASEFHQMALVRGRPDVARKALVADQALRRRKVLRDLRRLVAPGWADRKELGTDLLPWGRGPVPDAW